MNQRDLQPPAELTRRIRAIGGINPHGEPNFRVIWGWQRLAWVGGRYNKHDGSGNVIGVDIGQRLQPKYVPANRWYVEAWCPAAFYGTPDEWYAQTVEWIDGVRVETLGPYPKNGDYEQIACLQTPLAGHCKLLGVCKCGQCEQFVPLSPLAVESIIRALQFSRNLPAQFRIAARRAEEQKAREEEERKVLEAIEDARPVFSELRPYPGRRTKIEMPKEA